MIQYKEVIHPNGSIEAFCRTPESHRELDEEDRQNQMRIKFIDKFKRNEIKLKFQKKGFTGEFYPVGTYDELKALNDAELNETMRKFIS